MVLKWGLLTELEWQADMSSLALPAFWLCEGLWTVALPGKAGSLFWDGGNAPCLLMCAGS